MAVCNRCAGKGTIKNIPGIEPSRCPVCLGTGWAKAKRRSKPSRPEPHDDDTLIVIHSDIDPYTVIDKLPWGMPQGDTDG